MERSDIDKIDTKRNRKEFVDLYYKIALKYFVKALLLL
jgi:hypothetical protein